jgi:hypothetical protein
MILASSGNISQPIFPPSTLRFWPRTLSGVLRYTSQHENFARTRRAMSFGGWLSPVEGAGGGNK